MTTHGSAKRKTQNSKLTMNVLRFGFCILSFALSVNLLHAAESPVANEDTFLLEALWGRYRALLPKDNIKIGIALGGGGARGLAHIGVLKAMEEEDIPIGAISGTSVGAIIGGLYAAGITTSQMEQMTQELGWSSLTNYSRFSVLRLMMTGQKLSTKNMEVYLRQHIGDTRFDELKIPFVCVATDIQTGERLVFREGSVALAARASATIPGMFEPVPFRHRFLVDGGLVSNLPTDLVALMGADPIIAVDVTADFVHTQPKNVLDVLNQAIYIQSERLAQDELSRAQVVIRPQLDNITMMDLSRSDECIDAGVLAGRRAAPEIKRLVLDKRFEPLLAAGRVK